MSTREIAQAQDREVKARQLLCELKSFVSYYERELREPFVMRAERISAQERSLRAKELIDSAREFLNASRKILSQLDVAADDTQDRKKIFDEKHGIAHLEAE